MVRQITLLFHCVKSVMFLAIRAFITFLKTLTGNSFITNPQLAKPI